MNTPADKPIEICDHVFLGNFNAAVYSNLLADKITSVVCLTEFSQDYKDYIDTANKIKLLHINNISEDLSESSFTIDKLKKAVDFIEKEIKQNHNVLVHCKAGYSRSPTVVIAYLMRKNNWTTNQAISFVEKRAPHINPTYHNLLEEFYRQLL